ncbi:MAG TPA: helix-turn-helix transcriptional regulator [Rhizomicrobium sp.]
MRTDPIPVRDRAAVTREVFGHQFLRLDVEEIGNVPLHVDLKLRALPGLHTARGTVRGIKAQRTNPLMSDGNDDIFLTINLTGRYHVVQRRHDVVLDAGEAQIAGCALPCTYVRPSGTALGLRLPHAALASRVENLDDRLGAKLTRTNPALNMLQSYIGILDETPSLPEVAKLAVSHIYDLVALSLGTKVGSDVEAQRASVNAARLHAIKNYVIENLTLPDLNIGQVAAWHRLTPRQVQRLFERDGKTFSAFLTARRLAHAHDAFTDPARAHQNISQIIFESGFNDVSNFNRAFRRCYGASPSEIRNSALLQYGK